MTRKTRHRRALEEAWDQIAETETSIRSDSVRPDAPALRTTSREAFKDALKRGRVKRPNAKAPSAAEPAAKKTRKAPRRKKAG